MGCLSALLGTGVKRERSCRRGETVAVIFDIGGVSTPNTPIGIQLESGSSKAIGVAGRRLNIQPSAS